MLIWSSVLPEEALHPLYFTLQAPIVASDHNTHYSKGTPRMVSMGPAVVDGMAQYAAFVALVVIYSRCDLYVNLATKVTTETI